MKFSKTQLPKTIQSGVFITGMIGIFGPPTLSQTASEPLIDRYIKELINTGFKNEALADARPILLGKKIFKNFID